MTKKRTVLRVKQQTVRTQEPRLMNEIINDLLNGQTPFARARRHRTGRAWTGLYPNTEQDVDLKLVTQKQGRMELGEYLDGMITRDGDDHFTFVENDTERGKATRRNPSIYMGQWINVKRRADGTVYPTFKRTKGIGAGKLGDYAVNTTCELLMVAGKHEAAMALAEVEGFDLSELFATDRGLGEEEDFEQE